MTHYFNLSRTYCANVLLFLLLFSTLFAKVIIFQLACFEYVAVRLVFKQPLLFGAFWAGKIVMPLIIAAPHANNNEKLLEYQRKLSCGHLGHC